MLTRIVNCSLGIVLGLSGAVGWSQDVRQPQQPGRQIPPNQSIPRTTQGAGLAPAAHAPANGNQPLSALQPAWHPLPAEHAHLVQRILDFWEKRSVDIQTYQCDFERWKYDPVFVPADPKTGKLPPQEYSKGVIKYSVPDKALYKDLETHVFNPTNGWKQMPLGSGDHWICDGTSIFEFVASNKQVIKSLLPADMQGEALRAHGPLPFLFGAKSMEIQRRYWVRIVTPQGVDNKYHLEAWPKFQSDAAKYQKVLIILDKEMYLPEFMVVYNLNWTPANPARTSYKFSKRVPRDKMPVVANLIPWKKQFYQPPVPKDWKLIVQPIGGDPQPAPGVLRSETPRAPSNIQQTARQPRGAATTSR